MGNETEKNQNPGQGNQGSTNDPNKKNPSQTGQGTYNQQDPNRKNPGQESGTPDRKDREGSDNVEKRRAS
jgi:hypothetical protein